MKILVLHQPFPMGNYKLMPYIAKKLQDAGHEVALAQQFNGARWAPEALEIIKAQKFDAAYYEMLDGQTFEFIRQSGIEKKVLCYASKGIFQTFEEIVDHKGKYYTSILTNSKVMSELFTDNDIPNEFFEYYPAPLFEEELVEQEEYKYPTVYLGGGYVGRLAETSYEKESKIIYTNSNVTLFGNGWPRSSNYKGILPPGDIGKLYSSAGVCIGTIEPTQRTKGMINNRYSEMLKAGATIASIRYPEIDFYGGEKFMTFIDTPEDLERVKSISNEQKFAQKQFIEKKEEKFFVSLNNLLSL